MLRWYHAVRPTLTIAVQMNMTASCNSNLKATQGNRLRNWRLDYGVRKQCKADVSKVIISQVLQSLLYARSLYCMGNYHLPDCGNAAQISPSHQVPCLGFVAGAESATQHSQMKLHVVQHSQLSLHVMSPCSVCMYTGRILLKFASLAVCSTAAQLTTTLRMTAVGLS